MTILRHAEGGRQIIDHIVHASDSVNEFLDVYLALTRLAMRRMVVLGTLESAMRTELIDEEAAERNGILEAMQSIPSQACHGFVPSICTLQ